MYSPYLQQQLNTSHPQHTAGYPPELDTIAIQKDL